MAETPIADLLAEHDALGWRERTAEELLEWHKRQAAAWAGSNGESVEEALMRGDSTVRHHFRAVMLLRDVLCEAKGEVAP